MVSPGRLSLNWSNPGSEMGAVLPGFVTCCIGVSTGVRDLLYRGFFRGDLLYRGFYLGS